ncbi:RHS repeat domain-containing protein [Chryseobacterium artocarpi]|uniref:RHS repeat domain-containing protein n=1 Tax=Chryseobacterium artocarpi TaxID=1414727 RepID=UPI003F3A7ECC
MYDYGARFYMPDIGRWGVHDPLSELQFAYSPYSYVYGNPIRFNDPTGMIGEEDPPKKGSTPDNPIDIGEIKLTKNVSDSKLSFMGIQSLSAYHGSQDRLAFGIRNSKAALATEKFEKNLAFAMTTFGMGGSNLLASAGWVTFDTYMSYQDEDTQDKVGKIQLAVLLLQLRKGNISGIKKFLTFNGDEAVIHFEKHGKSVMDALGNTSYNLKNYVNDANHVINTGVYIPELNGYIKLIGGSGSAKFAFVGLNRANGNITTFHIKTAKELSKKIPHIINH